MIKYIIFVVMLMPGLLLAETGKYKKYEEVADILYNAAHKDSSSWDKLAYMCDTFGPRLTGSENLKNALDWIEKTMKAEDLENVKRQDVEADYWVRNNEFLKILEPHRRPLRLLGLGGSVGTPAGGILKEAVVFEDFEDLRKRSDEAEGKIVVFNKPFKSYGHNVKYRFSGADSASKYGAVAALIRSVSPFPGQVPHTGVMFYSGEYDKIPCAAITYETAEMFGRMNARGQKIKLELRMEAENLPEMITHNLMGEIEGERYPEQIIAIGGHIDSWDVGTGAHDDGGGCIATWEAVNLLKETGLIPASTVRVVMWANEENGAMGGKQYAKDNKHEDHILMLESDAGIFTPKSIGYTGKEEFYKKLKQMEFLYKRFNPEFEFRDRGGGVDIRPMMKTGVPGMGVWGDSGGNYFKYHHAENDTVDKVDPDDLNDNIAAIALTIYIYADIYNGL